MTKTERYKFKAEIRIELDNLLKVLLKTHCKSNYKPWCSILLGTVGAYYSLIQAEPILSAHRKLDTLLNQALTMLQSKDSDNYPEAWFVGYYLNTTEQRISSTLDRLLKIYHGVSRGYVYDLIRNTINTCEHCGGLPDESKTRIIFNEYISKQQPTQCGGIALRKIWDRVNELKHEPSPFPDEEDAEERWSDACYGLIALLQIFRDLALHRKLL